MVEEGEQAMKGQSVLKSIPSIIPTITPPALESSLLLSFHFSFSHSIRVFKITSHSAH